MLDDLLIKLKIKKAPEDIGEKTEVTEGKEEAAATGEDPEDEAKKKKSLIIRIIVIAGLAYYGYTEFLVPPPPPPAVVAKPKPKKVPKKDEKVTEAKNEIKAEEDLKKTEDIVKEEPKKEEPKKEVKVVAPPVEEITITPKPEEIAPVKNLPTPEPQIAENDIDKKIDQLIDKEEKVEKKPVIEEKKPKKISRSGERKEEVIHSEINMKDKIVIEENYTEAPPYDNFGRGLIYNCKDKYWACVSKLAFVQCNKNMKWNKNNKKPIECAIVNVYHTEEDCITVQQYSITTNQPTYFCDPSN